VFAPPATPAATVNELHEAISAASRDPALVAALEQVGLEAFTLGPNEYAALVRREREAWAPLVRRSGFRSED
jgi:tripartite-type tricarboxylate transporter receptor subunit TctC